MDAFCVLAITVTLSLSESSAVNPLPLRLNALSAEGALRTSSDVALQKNFCSNF